MRDRTRGGPPQVGRAESLFVSLSPAGGIIARLRTLCAVLGVVLLTGAGVALGATPASAQTLPAPSGGITFAPPSGSDLQIIRATTAGPCNKTDPTTNGPSNAIQAYVTGPGAFAPNPASGHPDGVAVRGATVEGFSATGPNTFAFRAAFLDLARDVGLKAVPVGTYTIDFRCVDEQFLSVSQRYSATITFTSPTAYTTTGGTGPTPTPAPSGSPSPTATPAPSGGASPSPSPSASPSPTASPTASPTGSATTTSSATDTTSGTASAPSPAETTQGGSSGSGTNPSQLAYTGAPLDSVVPIGLALIVVGALLRHAGRRGRI